MMNETERGDAVCNEADGCPTEIAVLQREWRRMDKELDIVHEALTEIYNLDAAVPIVKAALARIDALKTPNT